MAGQGAATHREGRVDDHRLRDLVCRTGDLELGVRLGVVADSGVENVNGQVNAMLDPGRLKRVLAQVEVAYSNSMIEAW